MKKNDQQQYKEIYNYKIYDGKVKMTLDPRQAELVMKLKYIIDGYMGNGNEI